MQSTLIDNSEKLKLADFLNKLIDKNNYSEICIATGYWDLPGTKLIFEKLNAYLHKGGKVKMIIGQEPHIRAYQMKQGDSDEPTFPDFYLKRDFESIKEDYSSIAQMLLTYCLEDDNPPMEIRVFGQNLSPKQFLHSKCYIFKGESSKGIIGSSNFTKNGLWENAELNFLETQSAVVASEPSANNNVKGHICWFDEKWELSVPWNGKFIKEVLPKLSLPPQAPQPISEQEIKPYDVYIRFLQTLWSDIAEGTNNSMLEAFLPEGVQKLQYQFDAVNLGYSIMKRHGGFILADVVGLGKTMVGIMLIKRFLEDSNREGRERNVLVVTPPAIKKSWIETIALFDEGKDNGVGNHITFVTTGSIGKLVDVEEDEIETVESALEYEDDGSEINTATIEEKRFGLILIDESHRFRNSETQMYKSMDELIGSIFPSPYIILISATPQNNSPRDLKNQIYLFQREHQNTTLEKIEGRKLDTYFSQKEKQFQELKQNPNTDNKALIALSKDIREKVLDDLLVRRTRTDIKTYYENDAEGLKFPDIKGPHALRYEMDDDLAQLFFDTMEQIAPYDSVKKEFLFVEEGLNYYRYRAIEYLEKKEHHELYQKRNITVEGTSRRLARIMQILLIKRLESSFTAFKTSLRNLQRYTRNMLDMLNDNVVFICPDIDVNAELNTETKSIKAGKLITRAMCYEDIRQKIKQKGGNNREYRAADFSPNYKAGLEADKQIIDILVSRWDRETKDPKQDMFLKELHKMLFNKEINNPHGYDKQKMVIFTEAIDTVRELKNKIEGQTDYRVLAITASNRDEMQNTIKSNFDANAKEKKDDYDIIVTTEVLAEGVNLHRSNVIVNYDTPWNSTRLMQRIGRVNRIGSKEDFVHVFNFMPTAQSEAQIGLVQKAHAKLQAFHAMFGEDNKVFTEAEELIDYDNNPEALRRLVNGEESVYEKYINELKTLKQENENEYNRIKTLPLPLVSAKRHHVDETVCLVSTPKGKGLYLKVSDDKAEDISTIDMIKSLQCSPETKLEYIPKTINEDYEKAIKEYILFFDKMMTAKDSNPERTKAIKIIISMKKKTKDKETKHLLAIAESMVRKGNRSLAKKIILLSNKKENELSLFEIGESDFNELILREFSVLKKRAEASKETNKPQVTLSTVNIL